MLGTPATGDKVTTLPFNAKHTLALGPAVPTIVIKKKNIQGVGQKRWLSR